MSSPFELLKFAAANSLVVWFTFFSADVTAAEYCCDWKFPNATPPPAPGAYACIVHRAVGFQGDAKKGERFAGGIKLLDEQAHFTLTLKKRADNLIGSNYCAQAHPHPPDQANVGGPGHSYFSDMDYWFTCKANYELQMGPSKVVSALRGDNQYTFMDEWVRHVVHFNGQTFSYWHFDAGGDSYMEEGECQKM